MTAYVVMVRTRMRDQSAFAEYARLAPKVQCEEFPEIVAFYGKHVDVEGAAADGVVILRFSSLEAAQDWYNSASYQEAARQHVRQLQRLGLIIMGVILLTQIGLHLFVVRPAVQFVGREIEVVRGIVNQAGIKLD